MKERADKLLVARGLAPSCEKAQALIMAGRVTSAGRPVRKPGDLLDADAALEVAAVLPFVSRGGLKLAEALDRFGLDVRGRVGLDIGASTGGFVDCLLQRGAARVYAVDVDTKQLDWNLTKDPRVVTIEKNARELAPADLPEAPGIVTMDVSFISVLKILPALKAIPGDWALVSLVKPQFEAGPKDVGHEGRRQGPGRPRRGPGAGPGRGPGPRLRARGPHALLDARAEGQRRILRPVGQGRARSQRGARPHLDQGGSQP